MTQIRSIHSSLAVVLTALIVFVTGTAAASADPIEAIWSFGGGRVGIQAEPNGTFTGTVVAPTKFALCTHDAGERMWTQIAPQPDGSYWGLHQWFDTSTCNPNPNLGPTAWRVMSTEGAHFLRVCFSEPGSGQQPTIAPDGTTANATYGCADSARIASLPAATGEPPAQLEAPSAKGCKARRKMRIGIRYPENEPPAKIVVTLRSGKVRRQAKIVRHGRRAVAILRLSGLSRPVFTVEVKLETVFGRKLDRKRKYRLCGGKAGRTHRHRHHAAAT
jgi:hypothetical protein